jgi:hypothetical protein
MKKLASSLVIAAVIGGGGFWLAFGTFDPCAAMRGEAERVSQQTGGAQGKAIHDALVGPQAPKLSGVACMATAVSLKVRGRAAVVIVAR